MKPHDAAMTSGAGIPARVAEEIDDFARKIADYRSGAMDPEAFKRCRLQLGIYGIRGLKDRQMVRVKVPSGQYTATQLRCVAEIAEAFATGRAHVTTRQDFQVYEVPIERTPEVMRRLAAVGMTTREACGNSVRNVTACPLAGTCPEEIFDVTPWSLATTRYFLRHPASQALPRKFKIACSGCATDCAMVGIHDLGLIATTQRVRERIVHGFRIYVGGGLGPSPKVAHLLEEFTPADQWLITAEAVIRLFDRMGNRQDKARARIKFLVEKLGIEEFRRLVFAERETLQRSGQVYPPIAVESDHQAPPSSQAMTPPPAASAAGWLKTPMDNEPNVEVVWHTAQGRFERPATGGPAAGGGVISDRSLGPTARRWVETNVIAQRQQGYVTATVRLRLGDLSVRQMRDLASIAERFSGGRLVNTAQQNVLLPWVREQDLGALHEALAQAGLADAEADRIEDVTSCPGADSCQIGITSSRGLARRLGEIFAKPAYQTPDLDGVHIKISGCPNSCGQHHIATIGFFGGAKRINDRLVPHYQMLVGGETGQGSATFGESVLRLPASRVPEALEHLVGYYRSRRANGESLAAFVQRVGKQAIADKLAAFTDLPPYEEAPEAYLDWGQSQPFTLQGMGQGECAGG